VTLDLANDAPEAVNTASAIKLFFIDFNLQWLSEGKNTKCLLRNSFRRCSRNCIVHVLKPRPRGPVKLLQLTEPSPLTKFLKCQVPTHMRYRCGAFVALGVDKATRKTGKNIEHVKNG
jgi:hypothetical protein